MRWHFFSFMVALFLAVVSCNNPHGEMGVADDETTTYELKLQMGMPHSQRKASRALVPAAQLCTHIDMGLYNRQGLLVQTHHQQAGEKGFGQLSLRLKKGDYSLRVVVSPVCSLWSRTRCPRRLRNSVSPIRAVRRVMI